MGLEKYIWVELHFQPINFTFGQQWQPHIWTSSSNTTVNIPEMLFL